MVAHFEGMVSGLYQNIFAYSLTAEHANDIIKNKTTSS